MTAERPPLAMTMGDPAGVGPELALAAWRDRTPGRAVLRPGRAKRACGRRRSRGFEAPVIEIEPAGAAAAFSRGIPVVPLVNPVEAIPGRPNSANSAATIESIARAVEAVRKGEARAIVTNPIAKAVLYEAGFRFPGHTEYLGELAKAGAPTLFR